MDDAHIDAYLKALQKWKLLANVSSWRHWSDGILARPKCYLNPEIVADLYELHGWMVSMEYRWPNLFPDFQAAFEDFRITLKRFLDVFFAYFDRSDDEGIYWYEKVDFLTPDENSSSEDRTYVQNYNGPGGWIEEEMINLSFAANFIIDLAHENFGIHLTASEVKVDINYLGGPHGEARIFYPEFDENSKKDICDQWLTADRLYEINHGTNRFLQPDFLPLKHREDRYHSTLTRLQAPEEFNFSRD